MAAKGTIAKENLIKRFATAVGADYVGVDETGKKYYFWSKENGERVQVCITMTVPKTPFTGGSYESNELNFEDDATPTPTSNATLMSDDEKATLDRLMKELNL